MAQATRRSYGSGRLYTRSDRNGRETYYGSFYVNGRRINRRLGPRRAPGATNGLTQPQAEKELRRVMEIAAPSVRLGGERMTVEDVSARYIAHAERRGRKLSTRENVESETRVHLGPFFHGKTLDAISPEDVLDLLAVLRARRRGCCAPGSVACLSGRGAGRGRGSSGFGARYRCGRACGDSCSRGDSDRTRSAA
jgi:hypothetical protein